MTFKIRLIEESSSDTLTDKDDFEELPEPGDYIEWDTSYWTVESVDKVHRDLNMSGTMGHEPTYDVYVSHLG